MLGDRRFHWADYLVFCASLLLSAGIGIYHAFQSRNKSTTSDYLMGGRNMSILPVAASLVVSLFSAVFIQGFPAEVYSYGAYLFLTIIGYAISLTVACLFYMPVYHRLKITSVFEYLELRYDRNVRIATSILSMFQMICYSSVALYAPAIATSQATGLPVWACILISAGICTFYTTVGGFRTVLWTDTLQCGIMIMGLAATLIKGSIDVGGIAKVMNISAVGGRTHMMHIAPDPFARHTIWDWLWGLFPHFMSMYATSQFAVQRFNSVRNLDKARIAMMSAIPIALILTLLACFTGFVAFAYYYGCDPMKTGRITSRDQTLSLLVMDVFQHNPGMAGVFLASVLSAALSTLSSVQNSFTAILLEDFMKPLKLRITGRPFTERAEIITSKSIVIIVGVTITCLSLVAAQSGKLVLTLAVAALSIGAAPIMAIFTLGLFVPFTNSKGAFARLASGVLFLGWIIIGSLNTPGVLHAALPVNSYLCPLEMLENSTVFLPAEGNISSSPFASTSPSPTEGHTITGISKLYKVSYIIYDLLGQAPTLIIGIIVSCMTGGLKQRRDEKEGVMFSFRKHGLPWCREEENEDEERGKYAMVGNVSKQEIDRNKVPIVYDETVPATII